MSLTRTAAQARPGGWSRAVLMAMEAILACNALGSGVALLAGGIDFDRRTVEHLPFESAWLGALALIVVVGLVPAAAVALDLGHSRHATFAHLVVGPVAVGWILVQIVFIGLSSVLQPVVLAYGVALTLVAVGVEVRDD